MQQRNFEVHKKGERRPMGIKAPKPKAWSHQADLSAAIGKSIIVKLPSGSVSGVLQEADAYCLKILCSIDGRKSLLTYFKHAIVYYSVMEN